MKYQTKPKIIEAVPWNNGACEFACRCESPTYYGSLGVHIHTSGGAHFPRGDDMIILQNGEPLPPVPLEDFLREYECFEPSTDSVTCDQHLEVTDGVPPEIMEAAKKV